MATILTSIATTPKWQKLIKQWAGCTKCELCHTRSRVVHYRGYMPCEVLFIGEAPGDSEDTTGEPFTPNAPAGELFESLRQRANSQNGIALVAGGSLYGVTNIVACRPKTPRTQYTSGELREPTKEEALACQPRLLETIRLANPKLIVTLGNIARKYLPSGDPPPKGQLTTDPAPNSKVINLLHPSAILRTGDEGDTRRTVAEKRWVLALADALKEL